MTPYRSTNVGLTTRLRGEPLYNHNYLQSDPKFDDIYLVRSVRAMKRQNIGRNI